MGFYARYLGELSRLSWYRGAGGIISESKTVASGPAVQAADNIPKAFFGFPLTVAYAARVTNRPAVPPFARTFAAGATRLRLPGLDVGTNVIG
jgi:hypothetical protein